LHIFKDLTEFSPDFTVQFLRHSVETVLVQDITTESLDTFN